MNHTVTGLYALLSPEVLPVADFAAAAAALAELGVKTLQLRMKGESDTTRLEAQRAVARALEGWDGTLVINDRADLAYVLAMESPELQVGLHLGQDDLAPTLARAVVGPEVVIGLSTHTLEQLRAGRAEPVDYLAFGPIFHTASKGRADPVVGVEALRSACRMTELPIVAIGGIAPDRARSAYKAGARAVAAISGLFSGASPLDGLADRVRAYAAARQ